MSLEPESVLLCEGYHDRAFLRSWLLGLGCSNFGGAGYQGGTKKISGRGQYALRSAEKKWVRIVPVHGDSNLYSTERNLDVLSLDTLNGERKTIPISAIVLFTDDDSDARPANEVPAGPVGVAGHVKRRAQFESWARKNDARAVGEDGDFELSGGVCPTRLSLVAWRTSEPSSPLLPAQQSLERMACAAVAEVYPERCQSIGEWLALRPDPPSAEKLHKTHAAAHMAGWFSDRGYEGFFDAIWEDDRVRSALRARMEAIGAARVAGFVLG